MWGAGYDMTSGAAARRMVDEFDQHRRHRPAASDPSQRFPAGARRQTRQARASRLRPDSRSRGLKAIVRHPKLRQVAMIMETPGKTEPSDEKRMDDLRALAVLKALTDALEPVRLAAAAGRRRQSD